MTRTLIKIQLIALFVFFLACQPASDKGQTAQQETISQLEAYVYTADDAFEYKLVDEIKEQGYTFYVIRMVSQQWLTIQEVEDPVWWHWLTVIVPDEVKSNKGLLFVSGGSHNTKQPKSARDTNVKIALATQGVVANLHNIPNQPTVFKNDDFGPRSEDEFIAYGWR